MDTTSLELDPLKTKHRAMWGLGDYPSVADTCIPDLGEVLVRACGIGPGDRVLDVAAGSGNAALPAAELGAEVTASDLSDELLAECSRRAATAGLDLTCTPGDAEALPFEDAAFDVVMSCVGVMFAPHHQEAATELLRVCRPGGRVGLLSWTPGGFIGRLFAAMRPFVAAPPPGAQPPPLWGAPDHVRSLIAEGLHEISAATATVTVDDFGDPRAFREFFAANYGPTIAAYRGLGEDRDRISQLDRALEEVAAEDWNSQGSMQWEYLLLTGTRSGDGTSVS
ncbi:MAG: methyltransferase domain-containing protein [Ornithinimicrobium sp.]